MNVKFNSKVPSNGEKTRKHVYLQKSQIFNKRKANTTSTRITNVIKIRKHILGEMMTFASLFANVNNNSLHQNN